MAEKAPWPDSTPEEDAAYALEAQMWDMEFERDVVEQGGPQLAGHVDPERARVLPVGDYNVQGIYRPADEEQSIMEIQRYAPLARELERGGIEAPGPDTAAVVGGRQATPQIWAHEFGHRRVHREGGRGSHERWRLIHDAFRSSTPTEWADAVSRWASWNRRRFAEDPEYKTYKDVERHLKETIASNRNSLIDTEVKAREAEGDVPKKREGFFTWEHLRVDQEDALEYRAKSWSIDKYNEDVKRRGERKASGGKVTMPSKSPEQARLMHAVASGWTPSRMKNPPSRAVAQEFVDADRKYSGGFAENRYWVGGLAPMSKVNAGLKGSLDNPFREFPRGGRVRNGGRRRDGGGGTPATTNVPTVTSYPWGTEAGTTADLRDRMGYSGIMGYLGTVSGLRQAGWTQAPGAEPGDLANTMWYPPEDTFTGGGGPGGPGGPPPRIIQTDPASYVGGTTSGTSGGGGGGGGSGEGSDYRKQLRKHQSRIENILGSAEGGPVNYYQEGGAVRPGHAEGQNPYNEADPLLRKSYARWEAKHHIDPVEEEEVAEVEEVPEPGFLERWFGIKPMEPSNVADIEERMKELEEATGGYINYQDGGLAIAAPAGGVPPWLEPVGSGPGYSEEPQGYQFGGAARQYRGVPPQRGGIRRGGGQPRRGGFRSRLQQQRGAVPGGVAPSGRGFLGRAARGDYGPGTTTRYINGMPEGGGPAPTGALAAMMQQAQQQRAAAQPGGLLARMRQAQQQQQAGAAGGITPGGPGYTPGGPGTFNAIQERARAAMDAPGGGGQVIGDFGGTMGPDVISDYWGPPGGPGDPRTPRGPMAPGGGRGPLQLPIGGGRNPNAGRPGWDPIGDMQYVTGPGTRPWKQRNRIAPPPGKEPGGSGPFVPGGPMVPPNMRGYLQKQRMMNRPPANVGGAQAQRVGMRDQQGALARAMQKGAGRAPTSRRMAFGRAGPTP